MSIYNSKLHLFGRTSNDTIAYRVYNDEFSWEDWIDLGRPDGAFISQPTAVSWNVQEDVTRLDVFAIGSDRVVYNRWQSDAEPWENNKWVKIGDNAGSPISACSPYNGALNLWGTAQDTYDITHSWWVEKDDVTSEEAMAGITGEQGQFSCTGGGQWEPEIGRASAAPHCIRRVDTDEDYELAYYSNNNTQVTVSSWSRTQKKWAYEYRQGGNWVGDPILFTPESDNERWDFFGLQSDNHLYHSSWTPGRLEAVSKLGGDIISRPSIISVSAGSYDVLALGSNGTLQHLHFDGDCWSEDWEDLGIEARSGPSVRVINGQVVFAAVAQNGSLLAWTRDNGRASIWNGSLRAADLGGDLSLGFLTADS